MTPSRTRDSLGPMAVMLAVMLAVAVAILYSRLAHAAPDTTPALTSAGDASLAVWTTDGPLWLAIAVVYTTLRLFLSRQHWLAQGRLLSGLAAGAGVLAAAMAWHFSGASVEGIYTAIAVGVALLVHPDPVPASSAPRDPQGGMVSGYMLASAALMTLAIGVATIVPSCSAGSTARQTTATGVVAALDCEAAHLDAQTLADARLLADAKVQSWISGAAPADMPALQERILADLRPIRSDLGRCAITGALDAATAAVTSGPGVAEQGLVAAGPDPAQVRLAFGAAARAIGWAPVRVGRGAR